MAVKILNVGDKVPSTKLLNENEDKVSLKDFTGQYVVLYFYPKDNTPGCTQEAKDFRDNITKFDKLNTVVLGVSRDDSAKHQKFIEKYDLPFHLLVDADGKLCEQFGVWVQKSMFGKKYMGIERSTFIINPKGEVVADWRKVKVKDHVAAVLKVLKELNKS